MLRSLACRATRARGLAARLLSSVEGSGAGLDSVSIRAFTTTVLASRVKGGCWPHRHPSVLNIFPWG